MRFWDRTQLWSVQPTYVNHIKQLTGVQNNIDLSTMVLTMQAFGSV